MRHVLSLSVVLILVLLGPAQGQSLEINLGDGGSLTARTLQLIALITVLSLAPGLAVMITCFPFIITVLSILRQAIGLQSAPPNMLLISLALFLTYYVMEPVFVASWTSGISPLLAETITVEESWPRAVAPFQSFMQTRVDPDTLASFQDLRGPEADPDALSILIPSFMLSEISRAFQIGFLIFLPFLIIDMVVAAVLMSMGMMMVPPAIVSLPFKLAFFVVADGWSLITGALVRGYFT